MFTGKRLAQLKSLPPRVILHKAFRRAAAGPLRRRDFRRARILEDGWLRGEIPGGGELFAPALDLARLPVERVKELLSRDHLDAAVEKLAGEACAHRFDLLGSGAVRVDYFTAAAGFGGYRYNMAPGGAAQAAALCKIRRLAERFRPGDTGEERGRFPLQEALGRYAPLDWHLDFRSGYRWDPQAWYRDVPVSPLPGADIKVPWELSRFQHLGAMGLSFLSGDDENKDRLAAEFVLQLTDWITANPPGCGVNWRCTMEVAVRAVNWLWGAAFFYTSPVFCGPFRRLLAWSLYRHAAHIRRNLENRDFFVGNHYLANLAGIIYLESLCPWLPQSDRWLSFAASELAREMERQVNPDGTGFEASTGYHRLSAEIFFSGTALLLRLPPERRARLRRRSRAGEADFGHPLIFTGDYYRKLLLMAEYAVDLAKPGGRAPLVGDFDSGRLHRLLPETEAGAPAAGFDGDFPGAAADFRHLAAVAGELFQLEELIRQGGPYRLEGLLLAGALPGAARGRSLAGVFGGERRAAAGQAVVEFEGAQRAAPAGRELSGNKLKYRWAGDIIFSDQTPRVLTTIEIERPGAIDRAERGTAACYPYAGISVFRSGFFYLAVSCGFNGAEGWGVHAHNDKLSFDLNLAGLDFIVDPGSYTYTALPGRRNTFRSTRYHNTLVLPGREQNRWPPGLEGLFLLKDRSAARIQESRPGYFRGIHRGYGFAHQREFQLTAGGLQIEDRLEQEERFYLAFNLHPGVTVAERAQNSFTLRRGHLSLRLSVEAGPGTALRGRVEEGGYSPAYGVLLPASRLLVEVKFGGRLTS